MQGGCQLKEGQSGNRVFEPEGPSVSDNLSRLKLLIVAFQVSFEVTPH